MANRVATIERTALKTSAWRHIASQINPADHASRGLTAKDYLEHSSWLTGPDFLWKTEDCWPDNPDVSSFTLPCELLSPSPPKVSTFLSLNTDGSMDRLMERYFSLISLLKATSWFMRFRAFLHSRTKGTSFQPVGRLTVSELEVAKIELIAYEGLLCLFSGCVWAKLVFFVPLGDALVYLKCPIDRGHFGGGLCCVTTVRIEARSVNCIELCAARGN